MAALIKPEYFNTWKSMLEADIQTPFPVLTTERLVLRQLANSDANEIFALRSNIDVNKYLDRNPSQSIEDAKFFIHAINENIQKNNSIYWAITFNHSDKLIGTICLFDFSEDNLQAEIGFELLPNFQEKGIMQEAISKVIDFGFQFIGLHVIQAYTHVENQASIKLLEKFNFKTNGDAIGSVRSFLLSSKKASKQLKSN